LLAVAACDSVSPASLSGPTVGLTKPTSGQVVNTNSVTVEGAAAAPATLTGLTYSLNGGASAPVSFTAGTSSTFSFTVAGLAQGDNIITVSASTSTQSAQASVHVTYTPLALVGTPVSISAVTETATAVTLSSTGGTGAAVTYTIATAPAHGTFTGTPPNLTYTSSTGYLGADSATFSANNGTQTSAPATITINVTPGTVYVNAATGSDSNDGKTPAHAFKTIQGAFDTAPPNFSIVSVAAGTYAEYLTINRAVTVVGPAITGALAQTSNEPAVVIQPPAAADPNSDVAIVAVGNSSALELDNVKIDGSVAEASKSSCSGKFSGVLVGAGSSATLKNDFFWYTRLPDAYVGCQIGEGVRSAGNVDVEGSLFAQFGKRAITVSGSTTATDPATKVKVSGSHFIGTDPTAVGLQLSQNGIVLWDDIDATVTNNAFESFGNSGAARADQGDAMVASDYSVGFGVFVLSSVTPATNNVDTVSGNTFANVQGAFLDYRTDASNAITAQAFLANNTMTGGYSVPGPATANSSQVFGTGVSDPNYLNYALAQAANWASGNPLCTPSTPAGCVVEVGAGTYCLTHDIFDLSTVSPAITNLTINAVGGAVDISIPDAALPSGYTAGTGVTIHTGVTCH
jgi:hypothetical protein